MRKYLSASRGVSAFNELVREEVIWGFVPGRSLSLSLSLCPQPSLCSVALRKAQKGQDLSLHIRHWLSVVLSSTRWILIQSCLWSLPLSLIN